MLALKESLVKMAALGFRVSKVIRVDKGPGVQQVVLVGMEGEEHPVREVTLGYEAALVPTVGRDQKGL